MTRTWSRCGGKLAKPEQPPSPKQGDPQKRQSVLCTGAKTGMLEASRLCLHCGNALCQNAADAPGQCTDLVLLGGDDNSRLSRRTNDRFGIDGLEGVNIQNAGLVAEFLLQDVRGAHRLGNHRSAGNDAEILILILIG